MSPPTPGAARTAGVAAAARESCSCSLLASKERASRRGGIACIVFNSELGAKTPEGVKLPAECEIAHLCFFVFKSELQFRIWD
jgi:hypothetical protein